MTEFDQRFTNIIPIPKGMSSDDKYCITLGDGRKCLLRISDISDLKRKTLEFQMMKTAFENGISVSAPYEFGNYQDNKIYQLTEWLDGHDLETVLPYSDADTNYALGQKAAQLLKMLHHIPAPVNIEPWKERFYKKIITRIQEAESLLGASETLTNLRKYLVDGISILNDCTQCFNHGDFNPGNLILLENGSLSAIDFNGYNHGYGDPIFETTTILSDESVDKDFKNGFRDEYYGKNIPESIVKHLLYYRAYNLLAGLCEEENEAIQNQTLQKIHSYIKNL